MLMAEKQLVLASSSPYRRQLLERLRYPFTAEASEIDETRRENEGAEVLVRRLSLEKARALSVKYPRALIIGSDQVATLGDQILGKPGDYERALLQLKQCQGRSVVFLTGLCLFDSNSGRYQLDCVPFTVFFRTLTEHQLARYLQQEKPYDSAGSFKAESLGISLFEKMQGNDFTALIGLPLIRLTGMLNAVGVEIP